MKKLILSTLSLAFTISFIQLNPLWAIANPENVSAAHYPVAAPPVPTIPPIDYAMISTTSQASLAQYDDISFNTNGVFALNSTFSHASGATELVINSSGTYYARYMVDSAAPSTNASVAYALYLNGTLITGSDKSACPFFEGSELVSEAIFQVSSPPATLTVRYIGDQGDTGLVALATATTTASLTIQKLSN